MHETAAVMIVDDNPDNLKLLARMLQAKGYEIVQYTDGTAALQAAAQKPPDLILLDIIMPGMDGFEVCRRLKGDETLSEIPVIFISALDDAANKVKAFSQGGMDYISKPFHVEEVLARVGSHLELLSLQRRLKMYNENLERQVAKRTRELAMANARLKKMDRLKNDFLQMISHEIRTPVNGILGVGELIIDSSPPTEDCREYAEMFHDSSNRLRNLIEDATMIADMDNLVAAMNEELSVAALLDHLKEAYPGIRIELEQQLDPATVILKGAQALLNKAAETVLSLAFCFSAHGQAVRLQCAVEAEYFIMGIQLDALSLSPEEAESFFKIESTFRSLTPAEALGLAPVAAHRILSAFGGDLWLLKDNGEEGFLEAKIIMERKP